MPNEILSPTPVPPPLLEPEGKSAAPPQASTAELERLRKEVTELRNVVGNHPEMFERYYFQECKDTLRRTVIFRKLTDEQLDEVARRCSRTVFPPGAIIAQEGQEWKQPAYFFSSGEVERWTEVDGVHARVKSLDSQSVGSMHLLLDEHTRFTVQAETEVVAYGLTRESFDDLAVEHPRIFIPIAQALASYIRTDHRQVTSGLFEQKGHHTRGRENRSTFMATSVAVFFEAFYRSFMNNVMNAQLDGKPIKWTWSACFPNMGAQIPTRVFYIVGLKEIRRLCADVNLRDGIIPPGLMRLGLAVSPGVLMCPASSLLEATHSRDNKEPMKVRWTRGYSTRLVREIVFGIGINQLSDYCREHAPSSIQNQHLRTSVGSVTAGLLAGHLSQIPHNLSTMKLMDPSKSYWEIWEKIYTPSLGRVPANVSAEARPMVAQAMAVLLPLGCLRRSIQIAGSFTIINGVSFKLRDAFPY